MSTLAPVRIDPDPTVIEVDVSDTALRLVLSDGRELAAPLAWFPQLRDASPAQRKHWRLIGGGHGIHWPEMDEDISVRGFARAAHLTAEGGQHLPLLTASSRTPIPPDARRPDGR